MHGIRSFLVVLFLEYFFRQNKFPVFLTYFKMSNLAKRKKNGQIFLKRNRRTAAGICLLILPNPLVNPLLGF